MFRAALGAVNPNVAGSFGTGRREINWDGVPDALAAPNNLPANFFNVNSPRGVVFSTPGSGFQVAKRTPDEPTRFRNVNTNYPFLFQTFSPQWLFSAIDSNVIDVAFFVPGSNVAATTSAFGAVFVDVDLTNTTSLQFFDTANNSLGTFFAAAGPRASPSRSSIQRGRTGRTRSNHKWEYAVKSHRSRRDGGVNAVVLDDFIYAEPSAVASPSRTSRYF